MPVDTQWRRRLEIEEIKRKAAIEAEPLIADPMWAAGVALYWGEGAKTSNEPSLANSDPRALRLFNGWVRRFHDPHARFNLKIMLHADNDEVAAREYWAAETDMSVASFYKTFVKPNGTGHRKNHLPFGVCIARMRRGTNALHRTLSWIDFLADLTP